MDLELRAAFPEARAHLPNGTTVSARFLSAEPAADGSARTSVRLWLNPALPSLRVTGTIPRPQAAPVLAASESGTWPTTPGTLRLLSVTLDLEELVRSLYSGATTARDSITAALDQLAKALVSTVLPASKP